MRKGKMVVEEGRSKIRKRKNEKIEIRERE